jgi:hypothetical protein
MDLTKKTINLVIILLTNSNPFKTPTLKKKNLKLTTENLIFLSDIKNFHKIHAK